MKKQKKIESVVIINGVEYTWDDKKYQELYKKTFSEDDYEQRLNLQSWEKLRWNEGEEVVEIQFNKGSLLDYQYDKISNKILVVYRNNLDYPEPNNAVVYNVDGSLHLILIMPKLIGYFIGNKKKMLFGESFNGIVRLVSIDAGGNVIENYKRNSKGEEVIGLTIQYPINDSYLSQFFEEREVNLETGEFGEQIGYGRN